MRDVIRSVLSKGPGNAQVGGYFTAVFYRDKDKNGTIVREYTGFTGRSALHVIRKKNAKDVTELLNAFEVSGADFRAWTSSRVKILGGYFTSLRLSASSLVL